jgi:hypothetical protein
MKEQKVKYGSYYRRYPQSNAITVVFAWMTNHTFGRIPKIFLGNIHGKRDVHRMDNPVFSILIASPLKIAEVNVEG